MREQFAGWGLYDNVAICLNCRHQHLIPKAEQVTTQPWLDWKHKHRGHVTFIVPRRVLSLLPQLPAFAHNADAKIAYAASAAYTITLSSLGSDTNLLAGRESTWISNASNKYLDELVAGFITVGTTPTANRLIEVHALGSQNDTPTYPDVFDGTDSAETINNAQIKGAICKPVAIIPVVATTSDLAYSFAPLGIRQLFGGDGLPSSHGLFVTHSTAVNLNTSAANHVLSHTPVYATVV